MPYGTPVTLGEIVVGEDSDSDRRFLMRVTNLSHGAEASADDWSERVAGSIMRLEEDGEAYELHDRDARLYAHAEAKPLGFLVADGDGWILRKPKRLPTHFSRVRRLAADDLGFLASLSSDVVVGRVRSGENALEVPVGLDARWLAGHVGVFATTGGGKSNFMKRFVASLMESRAFGVLTIDPHGEYFDGGSGLLPDGRPLRGLRDHPLAEDRLRVFSSRPLDGSYTDLRVSAHEIHVGDVRNVFSFSPAQEEALWMAWGLYRDAWLVELARRELDELKLDFGGGGKFYEGTLGVLKRRAEQVLRWDAVHEDGAVSTTADVLQALDAAKVVLVDTSGLYESEEVLVSAILARGVFRRNKDAYKDRDRFAKVPPVLIALEEAQRVLQRREGEQSVFAQIAREGRKFKTGLVAVTQQPKFVPEDLLSQFNTYVILGLSDARDRQAVVGSAKQDLAALEREIQTLEPGEAIITSPATPFPVPAQVDLYENHLESLAASGSVSQRLAQTPTGFY